MPYCNMFGPELTENSQIENGRKGSFRETACLRVGELRVPEKEKALKPLGFKAFSLVEMDGIEPLTS